MVNVKKEKIDLILHTPGGLVLAAEQIANALKKHPAKVTVFVPHYAMSGGTLISLAADEIAMDDRRVHTSLNPPGPRAPVGIAHPDPQFPGPAILRHARRIILPNSRWHAGSAGRAVLFRPR
jgi:membrane-bound ClpP family serine protease